MRAAWLADALEAVGPFGPVSAVWRLLRRPCDYPVHVWGACLSERHAIELPDMHDRLPACGVGLASEDALASALGEAFERLVLAARSPRFRRVRPSGAHEATLEGLGAMPLLLSPRAPGLEALASSLKRHQDWAAVHEWPADPARGACLELPAGLLFAAHSTAELPASSNGMAAGPTAEFAVLRGLYEVVERDAVMVAWAHRFPGRRTDEAALLPERVLHCIARLRQLNVDFRLHEISSELGFRTYMGYVVRWKNGRPAALCCGAGCSLAPREAALRAFLEAAMSWRGAGELLRIRGRLSDGELADFKPTSFSDHLYLYQHPQVLPAVDFVLQAERGPAEGPQPRAFATTGEELDAALGQLAEHGYRAFVLDATPPEVSDLGVTVVRVLIPGLVPLSWGEYSPLPTERFLRPQYIPQSAWLKEPNPEPHPFP